MQTNIPITTANPDGFITNTEQDYLGLFARGKTCHEAALIKSRSERTAKAHMLNLYQKFNVHNRAQLIAQAFAKGYLKAGHTLLLLLACMGAFNHADDYRIRKPNSIAKTTRQAKREKDISLELTLSEAWKWA